MMKWIAATVTFASLEYATAQVRCGSVGFSMAGSSTVFDLATAWVEGYQGECPGITVALDGGGSVKGASRVCGVDLDSSPVDVGNMSRDWKSLEATPFSSEYVYKCVGNPRSTVQIDVAIDGLTIAVQRGGDAARCIESLPNAGLTLDQLRWMFSSYNREQLENTGWRASSISNLNDNDGEQAHLWSDLNDHPACPDVEIKIAGADSASGTFDYFKEVTFSAEVQGEDIDNDREAGYFNSTNDDEIVQYLIANGDAIGFFGFTYYYNNRVSIQAIAIENEDRVFVTPTAESIGDGSYNPFERRLYMNLLNDPISLARTRPFIEYIMSDIGIRLVQEMTGYIPIPNWERVLMLSRAGASGGIDLGDDVNCGPAGAFSVAGSSTVFPVIQVWAGLQTAACPSLSIVVDGGGSTIGGARVCNTGQYGGPVDMGDMSRDWKPTEAKSENGWYFNCLVGDTSRSVIRLDVAIDGVSVAMKRGGRAAECVEKLGGLTLDQLRWIFSSYTDEELIDSGWDPSSVPGLTRLASDPKRYWSELNSDCAEAQILISGPDKLSGTTEYFKETILPNSDDEVNPETFDARREGGYFNSELDEQIVEYLLLNDEALGFFGFAYVFRNSDRLVAAPIQNSVGEFVKPNPDVISDGTYNPLSRRIYSNVLDNSSTLNVVRSFFEFGFSSAGTRAMQDASGYSPIPDWEKFVMLSRVGAPSGVEPEQVKCGPGGASITIAGSSTVFPVAEMWSGIYALFCNVRISVEGGGSSVGAARVCANGKRGTPVDIGDMSREWKESEAIVDPNNSFYYDCVDTERAIYQIQVATDGLSVTAKVGGEGANCIERLGGLTLDQLRWIYSSYTRQQLISTGWDASSVPNADNSDDTHNWNELDAACVADEIRIAGADLLSGTYEYFLETVLTDHDNGEIFDAERPTGYFSNEDDDVLVNYVRDFDKSIAYFGFAYYFTNRDVLVSASIQNPSTLMYIKPTKETMGDGSYAPLARPIYMNLWDDPATLKDTVPFLEFGFSPAGDRLVENTGYVTTRESIQEAALLQLQAAMKSESSGQNFGLIIGCAVGVVVAACLLVGFFCFSRRKEEEEKDSKTTQPEPEWFRPSI